MVRKQTWIKGTSPDQPIGAVAKRALKRRLRVVSHYLPLAASRSDEDVEYVHQLRVATRRAVAALRLFAGLLPKKRAARLEKELRRLRRSAGRARDLDVLLARLNRDTECREGIDRTVAVQRIQKERRKAQKPLRRAWRRLRRKGLRRQTRGLLKRIRWMGEGAEPTLAEVGRSRLLPIVDEFFAAAQEPSDPQALHAMRVRGKRLRYAMELLAGAFDESFRSDLYPVFADVQDRLGVINDHVTAAGLFEGWMKRPDDRRCPAQPFAGMHQTELRELDACYRRFQEWWTVPRCRTLQQQFHELTGFFTSGDVSEESEADGTPATSPDRQEPSENGRNGTDTGDAESQSPAAKAGHDGEPQESSAGDIRLPKTRATRSP